RARVLGHVDAAAPSVRLGAHRDGLHAFGLHERDAQPDALLVHVEIEVPLGGPGGTGVAVDGIGRSSVIFAVAADRVESLRSLQRNRLAARTRVRVVLTAAASTAAG